MLNKAKLNLSLRVSLIIIGFLMLLLVIGKSFSAFENEGQGTAISEIAFYMINAGTETQELKLGKVSPDSKEKYYIINVSNYNEAKISEVDMTYNLSIKTTTNIPVSYKLYLNDNTENIIGTKQLITDKDNMYFYKYNSISSEFNKNIKKTDKYKLAISFDEKYSAETYQSLIDSVEITVTAKQK